MGDDSYLYSHPHVCHAFWSPICTLQAMNMEQLITTLQCAIMGVMVSQITSLTIVYSAVYSGAHQRKHQSSASLAFVRGFHRGPVNSPHKGPVTRKMFHLMTSSWSFWIKHYFKCVLNCNISLVSKPLGSRHMRTMKTQIRDNTTLFHQITIVSGNNN